MTKLLHFNKWYLPLLIVLLSSFVETKGLYAQSTVPEGALNGVFSVRDGYQVYFSQGNLQYKASTNTWRFAENQYDCIGSANSNISSTYNDYIDLFGWGTSGYNHGSVCYQPWSTIKSYSDYYAYGSSTYNLFDQTGKADWGYNAISNGGNQENSGWRTLTKAEWEYVFNIRSTSSGIRYAKAKVNNVNGVILLPDDWQSSYYSLSNTNTSDASFTSNTISTSQWNTLEQHGAVFLPAAGLRYGTSVYYAGSYGGYYWSASYYNSNIAWNVIFIDEYLNACYNIGDRLEGLSVRLVFPSQGYSFGINASPSPAEGGAVSGAGTYPEGAECTLTATASAGYHFYNWTEKGTQVSTSATYTIRVTGDKTLVANFANSSFTSQEGTLNGVFSVRDGYQVNFSQGNLQYKASTNTWRFAANQYDYIGSANSSISSSYSNYIDLFGWGTSGYNHGATFYQPWSTSQTYSNYYAYGNYTYNLYDQYGQADWGYNAISNGGNQRNSGWHTLTHEEWVYLLNTRSTPSGIRYAKAKVNNVNGVILLPDDWQSSYYSLSSTNTSSASFSSNTITASQWTTLEQHGAVFLPAAGYRDGTSVNDAGSYGYYWSSSYYNPSDIWDVGFGDSNLSFSGNSGRNYGQSVRLVFPSQDYSFGINASPNPAEGGAVSGAGAYPEGAVCTLTATASAGYHFFSWTENGTEVSTSDTYTFTVTGDRTLVANFSNSSVTSQEGSLNGLFSVGDNTAVLFSQGNLQYKASTNTWRFAENQYDYIGDANSNISSTFSSYIDLFGWGTSGYNHGAVCYQPWSTSTSYSDYRAYGSYNYNLFDQTGKADWGYNAISNGGNQENCGWRTLTNAEWLYLLNYRQTLSGIRYAKANVNNVNGIILLPDDWHNSYYSMSNTNSSSASFSSNTITASQWTTLEQHGAVFLPAAGFREGTSVSYVGSHCNYWSTSQRSANMAYCMHIYDGTLNVDVSPLRYCGQSVRLVRHAENYSIHATPNPTEGGAASGAGVYQLGVECTLTATPSPGYTFAYWTQHGHIVSEDATYTFMVGNNRDLVANFTQNESTGKLNGLFSVGDNVGVLFSQGNLQYKASTNIWRFAENQYDYIGDANANISFNYSNYIDLFGWGTSGYNHGAVCYQPWSTSTSNSDYYAYGSSTYNLFDQTGEADWGYNAIINGGNQENSGWRTFTSEEWLYLINTRNTASGIRYAKATVNGVYGVILLPDDWEASYYTLSNTNTSDASFSSNIISKTEWTTLEQHGAVFLPATGYRHGTSVYYAGSYGYYWSASYSDSYGAYSVSFDYAGLRGYVDYRRYGRSVRLVRLAESYSIHATPSPAAGGSVSGGGSYEEGTVCTLTATPSTGYTFAYWTQYGHVVSEDATITFMVGNNRDLVANFTQNGSTGELNGLFSVGDNASVLFSQGNLQYKASTNTWHFAENQYDYIGDANSNISSTYSNYIDLFAWGTSGYNHGATCYQPWSTSTSYSDYYAYGSSTYNLFDQTGKADWGYNAIINGGNQENSGWRTFTSEEWLYLINTRNTASGIRYAKARVNGVYGVILLPDDWEASYYTLSNTNTSDASFSSNIISKTEWTTLEQHGAVFLPAAGNRNGTSVIEVGNYGYYWLASHDGTNAYCASFSVRFVGHGSYPRYYGKSVRLVRVAENYSIHATPSPAAGGSVSGAGTYNHGASCTLTATANTGYTFVNWTVNGTEVSTSATYTFMVTGDRTLVANFSPNTYTVTLNTNNGTINSGNVTSYTYGEGATLPTDVTRTGYTFGGWYDNANLSGTAVTSISTTATGDKTFWAKWTINSYAIGASANPTAGGSVSGAGTYNYGASCTLTATPATGYNFTKWTKNGTQVSTNASYTFTVSGAATYVAQFTKKTYTITATANPTEGGTITGAGTYEHGASCTLVATPSTGYHFVNWTQNGTQVSTNASYQFTVTGGKTLVANFAPNTYTVTLNTNNGTINSGNVTSYTYGEGATLPTDVTRTGYTFGGWYDNANLSGTAVTSISTTATGDKTFWAKWTINSYAIGASANPTAGGTVSGAGSYNYGASCTLVATPATGYNFTKWTKNNAQVSTSASYTFTVTEAADYVAVFTKKTYTITATANPTAGGTITGAGTYEHGSSCTLVATPATGYSFVNWTSGNSQVSTNASYQFTVTGARTLVANFSPNTYTVTLNTNNGTINSGNVTSYTYGVGATLPTDVTRTGYTFGGWYDNANLTGTAVTSIPATATGDKTFWAKWTINSYAIGASANPTEGGTVSGAGSYNYGASCTLTATPTTGYTFVNWTENGNEVSTDATFQFTVTGARSLVAHFSLNSYDITASANPAVGGTVNGAGTFNHGETCTLTANASDGYTFENWTENGVEVTREMAYTFTVTGARTLVANFSLDIYAVTIEVNPNEGGTVAGEGFVDGEGDFAYGSTCSVTATANEGYTFVNWTKFGVEVATTATYTFTVEAPTALVAHFSLNSYDITATANPAVGGTVNGAGTFNHGETCTLTATASDGYTFVNWTENGNEVSTDATFQFTVTGARSLVANFSLNSYDITASANPAMGGTVTGAGTFNHGETCSLTASAADGYTFENWTENGVEVTREMAYTFTVTGARTLVANFSLDIYAVTADANPTEGGTVAGEGFVDGEGDFAYGSTCSVTATANEGYTFVNWTKFGVEVATTATYTFTVEAPTALVAHFSLNSYDITATANPTAGGTVTGAGAYNHFESCTLTATASDGYTFENWTENGVEVTREMAYTFTVEGARTLVANFTLDIYAITAEASPAEGGTVAGEGFVDGEGDFAYGSTCTVTATANEGYTFVNWTKFGVEVATTATYTFTVEAPTILVANFSLNSYEITASANPAVGGTVTGAGTYTHGETVTLTATANEGYLFDRWVKDGETVSTDPSLSFTAIEDGEYVAQFTLQSYPIEITALPTEGGAVTGAGTYYHGDICTLTATPNTGYVFLYWIKDGIQVSTEASYTFTVTGPATYVANFVNFNYEVSVVVNPAEAGTVQGAGNYDLGLTCTLTATPNEGYQFVNWTVNGEEVSSDLEYSFTVTEPVAVEANFRVDAEYHEFSLTPGWNWWSTYIEMNGVNGLALLEDALGTSGIQIKSQTSFVTYDEGWFGTLNGIVNEQSYRINMGEGGNYSLAGTIADPTAHPIAIGSGWNWIGYVENVEMDLNTAMSNLDKSGDDIVKSRDYFSTYYAGYGWWGTLVSLQPGGGYMYKASASGTLVYPEASKAEAFIHSPEAATWWNPDGGSYADNMSVMAVVEVNGEEVRSEEVELGAFSQGECRGAVRLLYVAPLDRYVAFLTVHGEDGDGLSFRLKNDEGVLFASDRAVFAKDAVLGSTTEPYVLRFGNTGVTDAANPVVTAYPNPSTGVFQLEGEGMERVEVYTMLGELVRMEEVHADTHTLNLSGCAEGVYHLRVHTQNGLRHLSVVVAE